MKGVERSQVKQWPRCTNLSDKLLLLSAQGLTLLSGLSAFSFVPMAAKAETLQWRSVFSVDSAAAAIVTNEVIDNNLLQRFNQNNVFFLQ